MNQKADLNPHDFSTPALREWLLEDAATNQTAPEDCSGSLETGLKMRKLALATMMHGGSVRFTNDREVFERVWQMRLQDEEGVQDTLRLKFTSLRTGHAANSPIYTSYKLELGTTDDKFPNAGFRAVGTEDRNFNTLSGTPMKAFASMTIYHDHLRLAPALAQVQRQYPDLVQQARLLNSDYSLRQ